ncbi:MAG: hypothetical protein Kow0022_05330 [Phycisphaerales bacterium]
MKAHASADCPALDLLIPRPRLVRYTGVSKLNAGPLRALARSHGLDDAAWDAHTGAPRVRATHDGSLPPGGYRLSIPAGGAAGSSTQEGAITIEASDSEGLRNARATLVQLARAGGATLPGCEIEDRPAFSVRGVMLDVSRSRVPTMRQLFAIVDQLAMLKFNHLQLYIEHAFLYRGHEDVACGTSAITPDELTRLDAHARARGLTLAANQNCFGHMSRWLTHERYAHLAETHGAWHFRDMERKGAFSLCPTDPRSLDLVDDLIAQQLACVRGGLINIGCDETYDIGQGRSRAAVERHGRATIYGRFVAEVCRRVLLRGARPMFWADIALEQAETLDLLPDDAIALAWGYEPEARFGDWCRTCRSHGHEVWVCPGTSSWRSITGRTAERRENVARAVKEGLESGASGMLVCDWGDAGHLQQWPITLHALAHAADASWTGEPERDIGPAESVQVFADATGRLASWLDRLGDADAEIRSAMARPGAGAIRLHNANAIFTALWPAREGYRLPGDAGMWQRTRDRLEDLSSLPAGLHSALLSDELAHTLGLARFAAAVAEALACGRSLPVRWQDSLDRLARGHARLWHITSRMGGLAESLQRFEALRRRLLERCEAESMANKPRRDESRAEQANTLD